MERKNKGFTVTEVLTAVAIVALLIGILLPALTYVRNTAKGTMQKAQINTIEMALTAFRNDYGDYPPSDGWYYSSPTDYIGDPLNYCGAQKLAEALLGWDLLGFHPKSAWSADGTDGGGTAVYDSTNEVNLRERKGPYLELANANAFLLGITAEHDGLFTIPPSSNPLNSDTYVLCDVFSVKKITLANGETAKAGTPILYYKANTSSKQLINNFLAFRTNIYNIRDNTRLVGLGKVKVKVTDDTKVHPLLDSNVFYGDPMANPPLIGYIQDPKIVIDPSDPTKLWPYRPDSYILISAGADGLYGTADDITNFK
jgi:prepilin-type N-terminal cleavage/methylation domain-containing protein